MSSPSIDELFERLLRTVSTWPPEQRRQHGFDLLGAHADAQRRRQHARTVLVAESVLEEMSARPPGTVVLMKGLEVAQLYPDVVSRPFHDVDLLVTDPQGLWDEHRERGYGTNPNRRADIDHHHLPPLVHPAGHVGLELHHRPNAPGWAPVRPEQVFATAEPSRTPFDGILRPRDDLHALLLALHGWKSGFGRLRDLFDARVARREPTEPALPPVQGEQERVEIVARPQDPVERRS